MEHLQHYQYVLIALTFIWSGFVRSGLGFGGSVMSLPILLLIDNHPLTYLPIIAVHLLVFSSLTVWQNYQSHRRDKAAGIVDVAGGTVDWVYLKKSLKIMIIPKLIGVWGLVTISPVVLSVIIYAIVASYAITYILNKPFKSKHPLLDKIFLALGGYVSGTSLIGAPLIMAVYGNHVAKHQLRDTLFVLWFILVLIKMATFLYVGVDMQWQHHLWLLPAAGLGHIMGLRFHARMVNSDTATFFRVLGGALLGISIVGTGALLMR